MGLGPWRNNERGIRRDYKGTQERGKVMSSICTYTGKAVNLENVRMEDICIRDMALADRIIENVLQSFPKRDYAVDEKCINAQNTNYNLPPPILKKTTLNSNKEKECSQSIQSVSFVEFEVSISVQLKSL